jgi:dTDP-glucose 4,6-dehydratase
MPGMRILLTGAAGFVGSHVLRHLLVNTDAEIICPVTFRHKGTPRRIEQAIAGSFEFASRIDVLNLDLTAPVDTVTEAIIGPVDVIMNVASESHVDRSITHPGPFIENNVRLITNVLDYARRTKPRMVLHMSTDEVYGPAYGDHRHAEWETIAPSNPYSASKAAQEAVAFSYWRTYSVPVVITNTMNIIGELQDPEKFVPKTIRAIRDGQPVTVHVSPDRLPGSRFYLHARNLADAWLHLARTHEPQMYPDHTLPSRFNIVGEREVDNVEMVRLIADAMDEPAPVIDPVNFHASRPGHDLRYALDGTKLAATGWKAPVPFEDSLRQAVRWTLDHPEWLAV